MGKKPTLRRQDANKARSGASAADGPAPEAGAFDNWLEDKLRSAYSSVLDEPIPDDLISLINQKLKD